MPGEKRQIKIDLNSNKPGEIEVWVDPDADYYERVYPAILAAMIESQAPDKAIHLIRQSIQV